MLALRNEFGRFSGIGSGASFPDPFLDVAGLHVPVNMRSALYWAEYIFSVQGTYRAAMERVAAYFRTELEVNTRSDDESERWRHVLDRVIDAMGGLQQIILDRMCYGNGFASLLVPFKRFLTCPRCYTQYILREVYENAAFKFSWEMPDFVATCPKCAVGSGYRGPWKVKDETDAAEEKLKVRHWSPHEIETVHCPFTHDVAYLWRIPEDYKRLVRQGHLFHLERASEQVLLAIHHNQMFRFNPDAIYHLKEPTLSGIVNRGWGVPRILSNFRQIWYVQVLRRYNEALALDYVIPFRVITPAPAQGKTASGMATDPLLMYSGGDFRGQVAAMINRRRRDPAAMQVLPFPVNFQMFGADANQLAPRDLLDQGQQTLLNEAGVPIELYNGTLQLQAAPVALRLFESTWHRIIFDSNAFLRWLVRQVAQVLSYEEAEVTLKRPTLADDVEKQMMAAQLMLSQQLSGTTVLRDFGYDWKQEQRRIAEEARYQAELQSRVQEEMQQSGFAQQMAKGQLGAAAQGQAAGPAPAGAPAGAGDPSQGGGDPAQAGMAPQGPVTQYLGSVGPDTPQTPDDMLAVADSLASSLLGLPESAKDSELRKLKTGNVVLHTLVKSRMTEKREATRQAAGVPTAA